MLESPRSITVFARGLSVLDSIKQISHTAAVAQPTSVHEVAERLFSAYTVDDGSMHLAGCTLEDRLFVRVDFRDGAATLSVYVDADGHEVDAATIRSLGMDDVAELAKPTQPFEPQVERLVAAATALAAERISAVGSPEPRAITAIWCKYAEGKLRFSVGDATADLPFCGWARTLEPPPFICPGTGQATYHLGATDDGRIVAAEQIERCQQSGQRALGDELVACAATGQRVLPELLRACPVSAEKVLPDALVACTMCRQPVAPSSIAHQRCAACRNLRPVGKDDPRLVRLFDAHPPLAKWRSWKLSETSSVYVLTASAWLKQLLIVADKESLEVKLVATGNRITGGWQVVEPDGVGDVLQS
jgi:hypothetical protein